MKKQAFKRLYAYMLTMTNEGDPVHNHQHIDRVLNYALEILAHEPTANADVVIAAVLLHDIGRYEEGINPAVKHAIIGAEKAEAFLLKEGYTPLFAQQVADCIATHSYKKGGAMPKSLEGKIVYDGDKLDLTGTMGVLRAALYGSQVGEPLYHGVEIGISTPSNKELAKSLLGEYKQKLATLSQDFLTDYGKGLAANQQKTMDAFFTSWVEELTSNHRQGSFYMESYVD